MRTLDQQVGCFYTFYNFFYISFIFYNVLCKTICLRVPTLNLIRINKWLQANVFEIINNEEENENVLLDVDGPDENNKNAGGEEEVKTVLDDIQIMLGVLQRWNELELSTLKK